MSEFQGFDFNDTAPEVQIGVYEFDQERLKLYDWLVLNLKNDTPVLELDNQAGHAVRGVTGKFVSCAFEIMQRVERKPAVSLVVDNWYRDEKERGQRFGSLLTGVEIYPKEREYIDEAVSGIFLDANDDTDIFTKRMYDNYYGSIMQDVSALMMGGYEMQERNILAKTINLPLSTAESTHIGTTFTVFQSISRAYGKKVLQTLYGSE
jgi:hypothetical protein